MNIKTTSVYRATLVCAVAALPCIMPVQAAETDISNQPLATRPTVQAKPNLLFILDNSGSMSWSYMPDKLGASRSNDDEPYTDWYGYWSAQCNGVAYDPTITYQLPLKADGTSYPNASFGSAKVDGFNSSSSATNLADTYYYRYSGSQTKMGWTYTSSGPINTTFYQECTSDIGDNPGRDVFTKVTMTSTSSDAQNYANWYSYYRKRYLLMRSAMGRAITGLDANYRVGFTTINDTSAVEGTNYFRDVKDFNDTQKTNFYSSLYGSTPSGSTPLRVALSKAGRYFAKKVSGQTYDPMQYACQRNYALLSTDGYWNGGKGVMLDGSTEVGQQDGTEVRPIRDETLAIVTTKTTATATATRTRTSSTQTSTRKWTRSRIVVAANKGGSCSNTKYLVSTTPQTHTVTESRTQYFVTPQTTTSTKVTTQITTDGVVTYGPTESSPTLGTWANSGAAETFSGGSGDPTGSATYTNGTTSNSCVTTPSYNAGSTNYTTPTPGNWSAWSPATPTYTNSTPVVGAYTSGPPVVTPSTSGGTANTLADVAQYYYATDLRTSTLNNCTSSSSGTSQNVCDNIVRAVSNDASTQQHLNTFTIGLGLSGTLTYDKNYLTQTSGAYVNLTNGSVYWPAPYGTESSNTSGGDATNIDDLWHAAVTGRGRYYSALSASELSQAISGVVTSVGESLGASSAASTSSLELVAGENNQVYRASYTTTSWFGDLEAFALNGEDATIATTPTWSAKQRLDAITSHSSRNIYFKASTGLQSFTYDNLSDTQKAYFSNLCTQSLVSSQCTLLSSTAKAYANDGANLVNYLRGDQTFESASNVVSGETTVALPALYRDRSHILGDIINGAPVHVGKPPFSYSDTGYADFVTAQASRKPVVYVTANDGMLHAFSASGNDGGSEMWAYVPGAVMPHMYKLADTGYGNKHQYYVDGAPVMGDIKVDDTWKTILVGGLNAGGKSYYALDITNPNSPVTLWEFTDANMGLSYGNPIITKRADGTWVVILTSGYNNSGGDGKGHLYVLNANTGEKLLDIVTTAGSSGTPSGLAKINAWIDSPTDNTTKRIYGGDMLGNVWRFDLDGLVEPHQSALLLAKLQVSASAPQPITTKPITVEVSNKPVVIVATGRYMGDSDITDTTQQAIYAIKDPLTNDSWGDVRAATSNFVQQTLTLNTTVAADATSASVEANAVDWGAKAGWWMNLPQSRERVFSNMGLQLGTLAIGTAIPSGDACASGGASWRYYLNVANGGAIIGNPVGVRWSANSLIVGVSWIKDTNGNVRVIYQNSDSQIISEVPPTPPTSGGGSAHRTSWRELMD